MTMKIIAHEGAPEVAVPLPVEAAGGAAIEAYVGHILSGVEPEAALTLVLPAPPEPTPAVTEE